MTSWYWITAIGPDRAGIVAQLTGALRDRGINIEDASMSRFRDWFAVMLLASLPGEATDLDLSDLPDDLAIDVRPVSEPDRDTPQRPAPSHRISVYGTDRPGIVATVAAAVAQLGCNILGLDVDVSRGQENTADGTPLFVMVVDVDAGDARLDGLADDLRGQLDMEVHVVPLDGVIL